MRKAAPRKLVCLETYWGDHQARAFRAPSVLPFFEGLARQLDPPLTIAHRHVGTLPQFAAYTRRRLAWACACSAVSCWRGRPVPW
jgi:hypothetical protein